MAVPVLMMTGCEKPVFDEEDEEVVYDDNDVADIDTRPTKKFTFTIKGNFDNATFTRGYLQADGQDMTDLWVYDFVGNTCVQKVHQTNSDADFGQPVMNLAYGNHHVYFVASRGDEPTVDETATTIVWVTPKDTFYKDYEVSVVNTSNGNRAVTLDRVATKLRVVVNDAVPAGCASVSVKPDTWYYGLNYTTGAPVSSSNKERVVNVPASYVGTTGQLALSIFGLSAADEWTTILTLKAKDGSDGVIGSAVIVGAAFRANRTTEYSGSLFGSGGSMTVSLSTDWETAKTGTW